MMTDTYHLWEVLDNSELGVYTDTEEAVKHVGRLLSFFGPQNCHGRFVLTESPTKDGKAKIVYHAEQLWRRGLVYFDKSIWEARTRKQPGRWATY